jgi:hypothetical protein
MKLPRVEYAAKTLLDRYGAFHLAQLAAVPEMEELARAFSEAQARLRARVEEHERVRAEAMTAKAARDAQALLLNRALRSVALAIQDLDGNPRTSVRFALYFPTGLSALAEAPLKARLERAGVLVSLLEREAEEPLRALGVPLASASAGLREAIAAHRAAGLREAEAFGVVQVEKRRWLDGYAYNWRSAQLRFVKEPARAEALFRSAPRGRPPKAPPPEEGSARRAGTGPDATITALEDS